MRDTLYLTGFGPFPGVPDNPTAAVAERLHGLRVGGLTIAAEVLPVAWREASARVDVAVARLQPAAIVHLGVAVTASALRVEHRAWNELSFRVPDTAGEQPQGFSLLPDLPADAFLAAPWPAAELARAVHEAGWDAEISEDPGRYVCNATYLASLDRHRLGLGPPPLFVHTPMATVAAEPPSPAWTLTRLTDGVHRILAEVVRHLAKPPLVSPPPARQRVT